MIFRKDVFFLKQKRRKNIEKKIGLVSEIMDVPENSALEFIPEVGPLTVCFCRNYFCRNYNDYR